jgi:hypothetical protein
MSGFGWGEAAQAITQLAQSGINAWSQGIANKDNRHFAEGMMMRQRQWALEDWDRQNAYNSPAQQMQRFKEAGLNPNLVYNQQNVAQPVRSTETAKAQAIAPHIQLPDIQGIMAQSQAIKNAALQADNMKVQNALINAQVAATLANTRKTEWMTERSKQLMSVDMDKALAQVNKLTTDTDLSAMRVMTTHDDNLRKWQTQPLLIQKLGEQIAYTQAQTENAKVTKDKIIEATNFLRSQMDINESRLLTMAKQRSIMDDVQRKLVNQNLLMDAQRGNLSAQKELTNIKADWRRMGLSETFIENLFNTVKNFILPKWSR